MFLVGRNPAETLARRAWARRIERVGLQLFAESAYDESPAHRPSSWAAEQQKRRAFIALLWRKRVIRRWVIRLDGLEPIEMQAPCGAPLFIEGERWNDFAAELAALPTD